MEKDRVIVPEPDMPDVETVRKWLKICSSDDAGKYCRACPYYGDTDEHKIECEKLLSDADRIIGFLLG